MPSQKLSSSLQENLSRLDSIFGSSADFYTKAITLGDIPCAIALFTGISSPEKLWVMALDALQRSPAPVTDGRSLLEYLLNRCAIPAESAAITDMTDLTEKLSNGMSVLLIEGCGGALAVSTQEMPQRAVGQPNGEGDIRGSQEAFTELLRNNVSLLRRQFRTETFVAEIHTAKTRAKTEYALCYDKRYAPPELIDSLHEKLQRVRIPILLDSAYFASFLKQDKLNLFPAAAYTERPATACARLCEGKAVILVAGSPTAMVVPSFFSEHFESLDDYSSGAVFAGMIRILKYIAFLLSVFGPGLYVMAVEFAPETIPIELLAKLAQAEAATPLPLMLEMLAVTLLLEIVREAGLRAPKSIGHTVSLVGALILGETAVSAGIISTPVLTMAAAATVATLAVPSLYEQSILFRFIVIVLAGAFGLPGLACGAVVLLAMACGTEPFGYDYLYPLMPPGPAAWHDGVVRAIWSALARKGYVVDGNERK
ncbi:MAG TPA: spore germination protein [Candidatus Gemmiger faecigallinarum]|nr:spore germination protein [Candidatus Gemmiger faecigallinarum]